jgi:hypothetical protein
MHRQDRHLGITLGGKGLFARRRFFFTAHDVCIKSYGGLANRDYMQP